MSALPDIGGISYNGFVFPVETETTDVSVKPVYDQAERTVTASRFSLTIRTIINADSYLALENTLEAIVVRLTHPAKPFAYRGRGLPITINVFGGRDVNWGPKPRVISFKPLGGGRTAELTWTVDVEIPTCYAAAYSGPMEFNFSLAYEVARNGSTTRTYSGHVRVANNRAGTNSRLPTDSADYYRDQIYPDLLPGFRRVPGGFTLSTDRSTLEFRVVDEQFGPNIPPQGIVEVSAEHSVSNSPQSYYTWTGTISATYEVARNGAATENDALNAFGRLCKDRIGYTLWRMGQGTSPPPPPPPSQGGQFSTSPGVWKPPEANANPLPPGVPQPGSLQTTSAKSPTRTVLPVKFDFAEPEIYGPSIKCRYSLTYSIIGVPIGEIMGISGMWRPVPDGDWRLWAASMGNVLGPRGHAQLIFDVREDTIVDLCRPAIPETDLAQRAGNRTIWARPWLENLGVFRPPTQDSSWISYKNTFRIETDDGTIPVTKLPKKSVPRGFDVVRVITTDGKTRDIPANEAGSFVAQNPGSAIYAQTPASFIAQYALNVAGVAAELCSVQKRTPSVAIYMTGEALRLNFPIACPELKDAGGVVPEPASRKNMGEGFWTGVVGNAGWPVVGAQWNLRYILAEMPKEKVELPPNPLEGSR
jgi:hypothetical protein